MKSLKFWLLFILAYPIKFLKKNKVKILESLRFWLVTYPAAWVFFLVFGFLELIGHLKIINKQRLPRGRSKVFIVSNHPSFYEATMLNYLLFPQVLFSPKKLMPYSFPDKKNFKKGFRKFFWYAVSSQFVYVERNPANHKEVLNAGKVYKEILKINQAGNPIVIFPEGGRTSSDDTHIISPKGNKIRPFSDTVARVAINQEAIIVPIWVDNAEKALPPGRFIPVFREKLIVVVGEPIIVHHFEAYQVFTYKLNGEAKCFSLKKENRKEVVAILNEDIMQTVLALGDSLRK